MQKLRNVCHFFFMTLYVPLFFHTWPRNADSEKADAAHPLLGAVPAWFVHHMLHTIIGVKIEEMLTLSYTDARKTFIWLIQ